MDKLRETRIFHEVGPDNQMHMTAEEPGLMLDSGAGHLKNSALCGAKRKGPDGLFKFDSWSWLEDTLGSLRPEDNLCHECIDAVKALELIQE